MRKFREPREKDRQSRPFQLFQIEPTLTCNLRCAMCPWLAHHSADKLMNWETFECIAQHFPQTEGVDLSGGGEPLLHPRLLEMIECAKAAGCTVGFSTNATLLHPQTSRALIEAGLDWIAFSLDAATANTFESIRRGARFEIVVENIHALQEAKASLDRATPEMLLIFVMMRNNLDELPAAVDLAKQLGIQRLAVKNLDVMLKEGDERQTLVEAEDVAARVQSAVSQAEARARAQGLSIRVYASTPQETWVCEADPLHNLFVNWEGYIAPCITCMYGQRHYFRGTWHAAQPQRLGHIGTADLPTIWDAPAYRQFRQAFTARQHAWIASTLASAAEGTLENRTPTLPPAPLPCQTCYYLYGM